MGKEYWEKSRFFSRERTKEKEQRGGKEKKNKQD